MKKNKIIVEKLDNICNILDELQYNEIEQFLSINRNQNIILKKIEKLQEYNEIDDMTNAVLNKKIDAIQKAIV